MNQREMLTCWLERSWQSVKGMTPPDAPRLLLDLVFDVGTSRIRITGKAHACADSSDEVFGLSIYDFSPTGWWEPADNREPHWSPRDLLNEWRSMPQYAIATAPRWWCMYAHPGISSSANMFERCSAIEFRSSVEAVASRLVLAASDDNPCTIEVLTEESQYDDLLRRLKPIGRFL